MPKFTLGTRIHQNITVKKLFAAAAFLLCANILSAQSKQEKKEARQEKINALISQEEEGVLIYHKQTVYGIQLRSSGYGAFVEIGKMTDRNVTKIMQFEFTETKHPKEEKFQWASTSGYTTSAPFKFGKQNYFYNLRFGMGQSRRIADKGNKNGVSVQAVYLGGLALGLERPYYVEVADAVAREYRVIKYDPNNPTDAALFLSDAVEAGTGLAKGWNEIKINPGVYAKTGLRFDYGRYNEMVSAIEVGVSLDFYARKVPLMVGSKENQMFLAAYLVLEFGKRK